MFEEEGLERASSLQSVPESYEIVPNHTRYRFQIDDIKFDYVLKKGRTLPHSFTYRGFELTFDKYLTPEVAGYKAGYEFRGWWIFEPSASVSSLGPFSPLDITLSPQQLRDKEKSTPRVVEEEHHQGGNEDVFNISVEVVKEPDLSNRASNTTTIIDLERAFGASSPVPETAGASSTAVISSPTAALSVKSSPNTPHEKPDWLQDLKENFTEQIIHPCSAMTRSAVEKNLYIEGEPENKAVQEEIINMVMTKLKFIYGGAGNPGRKEMREIVTQLSYEYPEMFRNRAEGKDGKRMVLKVDILASKMCDRYREKSRREARKRRLEMDPVELELEEAPSKKDKNVVSYGVITEKLNKLSKPKPAVAALFSATNEESDFAKREQVYSENRDALVAEIRDSKKSPDKVCRGFMKDDRHAAFHFAHLTNAEPLNRKIEENLTVHLGHLETYLKHMNKTVEFQTKLDTVEMTSQIHFRGSSQLKDITILREASIFFDKDVTSRLVRIDSSLSELPSDPPNVCGSPHLVAVLKDRLFIFEVWAEGTKLLGNMDLSNALAAFFHISFCFNYKYPKGGSTLADLLQRNVAKYGDNSGTRTGKRRDLAERKLEAYNSKLFTLIT